LSLDPTLRASKQFFVFVVVLALRLADLPKTFWRRGSKLLKKPSSGSVFLAAVPVLAAKASQLLQQLL